MSKCQNPEISFKNNLIVQRRNETSLSLRRNMRLSWDFMSLAVVMSDLESDVDWLAHN